MSATIQMYFWGAPTADEPDAHPEIRRLFQSSPNGDVIEWPEGALFVEVVVPGVGRVELWRDKRPVSRESFVAERQDA